MGEEVNAQSYTREQRQRYREKVRQNLDVFERMLAQSQFEFDRPMTGMEIELNLVDDAYQPKFANAEVLEEIADPGYQTELARYNIELNVPPRPLPGDSAIELEDELRASLNAAECRRGEAWRPHRRGRHPADDHARALRGRLDQRATTATRPSTTRSSTPAARTSTSTSRVRRGSGSPPTATRSPPSRPARACSCTSRSHRRTSPRTGTPPRRSWRRRSRWPRTRPYFFGKRLHAETRIELFSQATDTRSIELKNQAVRPRVFFGERWITSIFDLFEENVRYFPALLAEVSDEDPVAMLEAGEAPEARRAAAAQRHRLPLEPTDLRRGRRHARTCGSRTASCRPGRPSSTSWPTRRSTTGSSASWRPTTGPIWTQDELRRGRAELPQRGARRHRVTALLAGFRGGPRRGAGAAPPAAAWPTRAWPTGVSPRRCATATCPSSRTLQDEHQRRVLADRHRPAASRAPG